MRDRYRVTVTYEVTVDAKSPAEAVEMATDKIHGDVASDPAVTTADVYTVWLGESR